MVSSSATPDLNFALAHSAHGHEGPGACLGKSWTAINCRYKLMCASVPASGELNKACSNYSTEHLKSSRRSQSPLQICFGLISDNNPASTQILNLTKKVYDTTLEDSGDNESSADAEKADDITRKYHFVPFADEKPEWKGYIEWKDCPEKKAKAAAILGNHKSPPPLEFQLGPIPETNPVEEFERRGVPFAPLARPTEFGCQSEEEHEKFWARADPRDVDD
jgi:hypothetical protein